MRISYINLLKKSSISLKKNIPEDIREEVQSILESDEASEQFDNITVLNGINRGDYQNYSVKVNSYIGYPQILFFIFFPIITAVCWFILSYSILYRVALYIIYGSSKK